MSSLDNKYAGSYDEYLNRELSLIEFNYRVLLEAQNKQHPLLERLKFISILSSNLDEFFMIRVAGLKSQISAGLSDLSYDGQTASQQLKAIRTRLLEIYKLQENILKKEIFPELKKHGISFKKIEELDVDERSNLRAYFKSNILPVLTPLVLDSAHPFPRLIERSLNIAFVLKDPNRRYEPSKLAFLQIPKYFDRFIPTEDEAEHEYILLEYLIKDNADLLFPGLEIETANTFRVTRDADIEISEDEADDLLEEIEEQIKERKWARNATRLEVSQRMPEYLVNLLVDYLEIESEDVYIIDRPLKLGDFMWLLKIDMPELKDEPFNTRTPPALKKEDIFEAISEGDILLHHPYDSFTNSTLKFINAAATDKDVAAIKITLYRTSGNSMIIKNLKTAAENGKEVTAFVELKARFDEENNIIWARELEQAGVNVVYGILGLKTHCKVTLVVRKESGKLKKYMHLGTGNYHEDTARLYTDVALLNANQSFGEDVVNLFNVLTGYSKFEDWNEIGVAPKNLANKIIKLIERETELHSADNPGEITLKVNQIAQREVIQALYNASKKGVKIKAICRGVCCLKPGVEGLSENIEVRSIIGRFLEHSRIFYFKNAGNSEYFISSADLMTRNLHKRVEVMTPIYSTDIQKQLDEILSSYWKDNSKSWRLKSDGSYEKIKPEKGKKSFNAQKYFLNIYNSTLVK